MSNDLAKRSNCAKSGEPFNGVKDMQEKELEVFRKQVDYYNEKSLAELCEQKIIDFIEVYIIEIKDNAPQMPQAPAQQAVQVSNNNVVLDAFQKLFGKKGNALQMPQGQA